LKKWKFEILDLGNYRDDETAFGMTALIDIKSLTLNKSEGYTRFVPEFLFSNQEVIE